MLGQCQANANTSNAGDMLEKGNAVTKPEPRPAARSDSKTVDSVVYAHLENKPLNVSSSPVSRMVP